MLPGAPQWMETMNERTSILLVDDREENLWPFLAAEEVPWIVRAIRSGELRANTQQAYARARGKGTFGTSQATSVTPHGY